MKPFLDVRYVLIKAIPIYVCSGCGFRAEGSAVRIETKSMPDLPALPVSNHHMPEGWRGYGEDKHSCPDCKEKSGA